MHKAMGTVAAVDAKQIEVATEASHVAVGQRVAWRAPVTAAIPTLLVSGALDPATPPEFAEAVARGLRAARSVVVPRGSHMGHGACIELLAAQVIESGADETADVGEDDATPVTEDYKAYDNKFTGRIDSVTIDVKEMRRLAGRGPWPPRSALW